MILSGGIVSQRARIEASRLLLPRDPALRPSREFVEERYAMFRKAG